MNKSYFSQFTAVFSWAEYKNLGPTEQIVFSPVQRYKIDSESNGLFPHEELF